MSPKGPFEVTVKKVEVVAPEMPMQEHWLPQSNLDLLLPPIYPTAFYCYKKPSDEKYTFEYIVGVLKKALAETLVPFYALSGEILQNALGEPELLCSNRGVEFTVAYADVELKDINFYNPDESVGGKLVSTVTQGVCAVQATELKCGGIVVGCSLDHRLTDGHSTQMFLQSWVMFAQGKPLSQTPSFRRSVLSPRHPGSYDSIVENTYIPISSLPPPKDPQPEENQDDLEAISRIYYVKADQIAQLQSLANAESSETDKKRSKFEAFSAFLWKTLASSVDKSNDKICRLGIVVDGRYRLGAGDEKLAKALTAYYGNVLSIPFGEKKCEELNEKSLSWTANQVHEFLDAGATKEHFLGLIDFVESRRPAPQLAKIYATSVKEEGPAVVVSGGHQYPVAKMDFGWGCSLFSSYYFPWGGQAGYVVTMPSPVVKGDWVVYMHLLKEHLDHIETRAADFLKPLSSHYLNLN